MAETYVQSFSGPTWTVQGLTHDLGTEDLVFAVYDASSPRTWMEPGYATVNVSTFEFIVGFDESVNGLLVLAAGDFAQTFASATTWTLPGATHGLGSKSLIPMCWDTGTPRQWIIPQGVTVHATSFDVVVTWGLATDGTLVLVEAPYSEAFTNQTTVTATGVEHGQTNQGLLTAVYDTATPAQWIGPGQVDLYQATFDLVLGLFPAMSGSFVVHGDVSGGGPGGGNSKRRSRCGLWYHRSLP